MYLESFRVSNFRSINDSGEVNVSQLTALLGRNESGKSNLLKGLASINPSDGFNALNSIKDFPRHRRLEECKDDTQVLWSKWSLNEEEQAELTEVLPRASGLTQVTVSRRYDNIRHVGFVGLGELVVDQNDVKGKIRKVVPAIKAAADKLEDPMKSALNAAADSFESSMTVSSDKLKWAQTAQQALKDIRKALAAADAELSEKQDQMVDELDELAESVVKNKDKQAAAQKWVIDNLPKFIFIDEYPDLKGHQNIATFLDRKAKNTPNVSDANSAKLCKVAGLDPQRLQELLGQGDHEIRNQLANRAGSVVTTEIRRLWKDRALKIRFNIDAAHLDTLISDPNSLYDVEVNLNERSRGFQWFFSFYITFAADTNGGGAESAIILLDEPGLYLHARSQTDLLGHLEKDFNNQVLYTTHSPFMVPTHKLDSVRTVSISETAGTTVTNDPSGDARTLFPLQAALGYNIAQGLFIGSNNLVVEGVTDFWFITAASTYLIDNGRQALNADLTVTPVGGAQKVSYMVALLTSEEQNVLVLLDSEKDAIKTKANLVHERLISEHNVIFVSEAFASSSTQEADIEDLLESAVYESLVRECYSAELTGKTLILNVKIPRIARRVEAAFDALNIKYNKTRTARLWLTKMSTNPSSVMTDGSAENFERLFQTINERLAKHTARKTGAFR